MKTPEKKPLTLKKVFEGMKELAYIKGKSSFNEKEKILMKLFFDGNSEEIKYIIRSLQKSLKIGASFKTIIAALSRCISRIYKEIKESFQIEEKEVEKYLLISINQMADYDIIMNKIIECITKEIHIKEIINLCPITPGIPLKPQLARPTTGIKIIFQRFENVPFTCEYKYDGFRGQIHHYICSKTGNLKTEIYSRNLENMTESYPDVVKYVEEKVRSEKIESFILDCEIVAFDSKTNKIQPFQVLTTRARKNVNIEEISIKVCLFMFDLIYLNGNSIITLTLDERRKILKENFAESDNIKLAKFINSDKFEEIEVLMNDSIQAGNSFYLI
jgi:DNA ligase-1